MKFLVLIIILHEIIKKKKIIKRWKKEDGKIKIEKIESKSNYWKVRNMFRSIEIE